MRDQCVEAITQAAVKMGRKVDSVYLRNIEDKFIKAKTQLARQDREKWAGMSEAERLNKAGDLVAQDMIHEGIKKRQRLERQMVKEAEKRAALDKMEQRLGKLEALQRFTWTIRDNRGGVETMERRSNAISSNMMRKLTDLWELERSNLVNLFTDKKVQMDLMMELYGQDSGNPLAKKAAEGYKKVVDKAIKDMNDLGFDVRLLESWRSPQKMSFYRIWDAVTPSILERRGKTAKEIEVMMNDRRMAVAKDMLPHIDRKMMVNLDGTLMDDAAVLKFLDEGLKSILTNGMNKESGSGAGSMLAKRHSQERQFHWKSPESFMYVMGKYSDSNPIDMMWSAFENIGREMAMVEKFGPNAVDGFNTEIERLANAGVPANKLRKEIGLFESFIGTQNQSASPRLDRTLQNLRQMMGAVYLGSNTISQVVDQVTLLATARAMNIPMVEVFMRQGKLLADSGERSMLRSMGAGLETAAQGIARLSDQGGALFGAKATNAVLTLNLSNYLTSIPRMAMYGAVVDHIGNLTRQADSLSKLGNGDRMLMEARGLTDEQWSIFREAGKDGKLTPDAIEALPDDQVLKLIPEKVAEIQAKGKELQSRMDAQNQKEQEWLGNRKSKFAEWRASMDKMINDYVETRNKRVEAYDESVTGRIGEMYAKLDVAQARADIAEASMKAQQDNRSTRFFEQIKRGMEIYGNRRSSIGETLGAKRHSQKLAQYALDKELASIDKALSGKFAENVAEVKKAVADYDAYAAKLEQRIENATKKNGQPKAGKEGTIERAERLGEEAKVELEAIKQRADSSLAKLRERLSGNEMELEGLQKVLDNRRSRAETEADIAAYLETEKNAEKIKGFIDTLNFRGDQAIERGMSEGEMLGYRKAAADYRARALMKNLESLEKRSAKEGFKKATEIEKRIDKRMKELDEYEARATERMEKRDSIVTDWENQIGKQYALAANKARNDALYQLIGIALDESHMASTQPSFRSTHALDQYVGDSSILKLMTQFKSFPIAFFMQHIMERGLGGGHGVGNKWAYTASLVTASTVMGGVALLLSDLAAGRDPREVVDEEGKPNAKFMAQAFFKGGGLGIVGDLFNTENWEGQDPIGSQMGPGVGYIVDLAQLGLAAGQYAAAEAGSSDEEKARKRMGSEGTRVLRSSIPGQNIWWARGVFNNLLLKDVNEFMSPGYSERAQQRAEKNYSSQYFIGGDEGVRAPNLSNIMGRD